MFSRALRAVLQKRGMSDLEATPFIRQTQLASNNVDTNLALTSILTTAPVSNMLTLIPLKKLSLFFGLATCAILSACTNLKPPAKPKTEAFPVVEIQDTLNFDEDTLYALITAELALSREHYELGLSNYTERAVDYQDVNLAARATQIARILKNRPESLRMAELWLSLDPSNEEARFILVSEYILASEFDKAFTIAQQLLKAGHPAGFEDIAIDAVEAKYSKLPELATLYQSLLRSYPDHIELLTGDGIIQLELKNAERALTSIEHAHNLAPKNLRVLYQKFRILLGLGKEKEAIGTYAKLLALEPDNFRVRNRYAHLLIRHDIKAAAEQYTKLHSQAPQNNDVLLNLALVCREIGETEKAKSYFLSLVDRKEHLSTAYFNLGELARAEGQDKQALHYFLEVKDGHRYVEASSESADIINTQEDLEHALLFLEKRRESAKPEDKESLFLVEAETLSSGGLYQRAENTYARALFAFPNSPKLLYSRGMHFAAREQTNEAAQDLLLVLEQLPDNAATLNALGYTLLSQSDRIDEADRYIRKAFEQNPNDPAILDSLGWLEFKQGNIKSALKYLQLAFDAFIDDEIASHLGEALWTDGQTKQAQKVWKQGLKHAPESAILLKTLKRLKVELN